VLDTWEEQLNEYVKQHHELYAFLMISRHIITGNLDCRRHHGKFRVVDTKELEATNVVLTTYHTVSAEWKTGNGMGTSILFAVRWKRIILDEGREIDVLLCTRS